MPAMTEDGIREAIRTDALTFISVDTSIFDRYQRRLEGGLLRRLSQFVGTRIAFVLAEVVFHELMAHLTREAQASEQKLKTALKEVITTWQMPEKTRGTTLTAVLEGKSASERSGERMEAYKRETNFQVVPSSGRVDIAALQERYFSAKPPPATTSLENALVRCPSCSHFFRGRRWTGCRDREKSKFQL